MILDSNVIIYSNQPGYESILDYLVNNDRNLAASQITQLDMPITGQIIAKAIRLRQQRKRSLGDSIIAATGLVYQQPVLTNHVADFADVDGLQIIAMTDILRS